MESASPRRPPRAATQSAVRTAAIDVAIALPVVAVSSGVTWWVIGPSASYGLHVAVLYAGLAVLLIAGAPPELRGPGLGAANRVTLARATIAIPIGALALRLEAPDPIGLWWVIALSTTVMVLDGIDGRVARRSGTQTEYGARFDMELDAALILALSLLVWSSGKVAAWVLLIGGMRYAFVAAGWILPVLRGHLPPGNRRRVVCVVQGVVLLVALGPIIPTTLANIAAAAGLLLLAYSFGVDVAWLIRNGRLTQGS